MLLYSLYKKFFLIFILVLSSFSVVFASNNNPTAILKKNDNPTIILKKVEQTYKSLSSYYDKGTIFTDITASVFETYYKPKNFLLYEWFKGMLHTSKKRHYWICSNDRDVYAYKGDANSKSEMPAEKIINLRKAIVSYFGIADGALGLIPGLFFNNLGFTPLTRLGKPQFVGEDTVQGELCNYLTVEHSRTQVIYHLWILKKNNLIKMIKMVFPTDVTFVFLYETIKTDINIPDTVFQRGKQNL